jgi:cell division protein FtsB
LMNLHVRVWTKLQSLGFFVFAAVVACGVGLLFLPLLRQSRAMQQESLRLDREIARQETLEKQQKTEIEALKSDPGFVERTARNKLNLARPGETIFRFEPAPNVPQSPR